MDQQGLPLKSDQGAGLWRAMISAKLARDGEHWRIIGYDGSVLADGLSADEAARWIRGPAYGRPKVETPA
jgi:hypothetical protein